MGFDYKLFLEELLKEGFIKNKYEFESLLESANTALLITLCERLYDENKKLKAK